MAKKRYGFVTNSSSSSFLIAYRKGLCETTKGNLLDEKIKDFLKHKDGLDTYPAKYLNAKEIESIILHNFGCETIEELIENDDEDGLALYSFFTGLSQNEYYFAIKEIGNWDDCTLKSIKNLENVVKRIIPDDDDVFIIRELYW